MRKQMQLRIENSFMRSLSSGARWWRGLVLVPFVLAFLALSPAARAVTPPPDGGYPRQNTAEGDRALFSLTTGATDNTAVGFQALARNLNGSVNTAVGSNALSSLTASTCNTATGAFALEGSTGNSNTADGAYALSSNTSGVVNVATGLQALLFNTTGGANTATGTYALQSNTTASDNTASGYAAMQLNTTGYSNTAVGHSALYFNSSGHDNIAIGRTAGSSVTTGNNNIEIGNLGVTGDSNTIRIGTGGTQTNTYIAGISGATVPGGVGVIVDTSGHLGTIVSSERFKDNIQPMDRSSEVILSLQPVTFHYKHDLDPEGIPQFGLVAEQVAKVNPDLVARDEDGKPYTVRYEAVNAMLLNEFLKEHRKVHELEKTVTELRASAAEQKALQATLAKLQSALERQAVQLQKVSERVEPNYPATRVVAND